MKYKIFLAWQSQDRKTANFIKNQIREAITCLESQGYEINLIERPTQEETGSPNINTLIWEQILDSDIFIADISFAYRNETDGVSNPNVMYELGIADALLGQNRTILLCSEGTDIEKVAFDINHNRISTIRTTNTKAYENLTEWIKLALQEADRQRYIKTYSVEEYASDIILLLNYFSNLAGCIVHEDGCFVIPSVEEIITYICGRTYSDLLARATFSKVITEMDTKLMRLYPFSDKRIIWCVMNIIKALKDYQFLLDSVQWNHLHQCDDEKFCVIDKKSLFLKPDSDIEEVRYSVYFNDNMVIYGDKENLFVVDKRIVPKDAIKVKQNVQINEQEGLTMVLTATYGIKNEWVEVFSAKIHAIIEAILQFNDYCGLLPDTKTSSDGKVGIISMKLKKHE